VSWTAPDKLVAQYCFLNSSVPAGNAKTNSIPIVSAALMDARMGFLDL
jgi:hypothetical protein